MASIITISNQPNMEAIEFINNFEAYLSEREQVVKPEHYPAINRLRENDPHDLVRPDTWFQGATNARGYVWALFLQEIRKAK
jgi:hypothetical protein